MNVRHNLVFIYLLFLAFQFVAIDTFCPNTAVPANSMIELSEPSDGNSGNSGNTGRVGQTGNVGNVGRPSNIAQQTKSFWSTLKEQIVALDQQHLSMKGLAFMVFGLEAFLTAPMVIFSALSLRVEEKTAARLARERQARLVSITN
ncbi:hypothetical protein [Loigolactobacillus iwatensis]|uniref:hypothetical protein n=1 Tax=Loigolactobacillus iwatensis TaxID=1267156 RepID=UPI000F7D9646|nr:hypothetical protein [Loigolactobacillus iwatensis]